MSQIPSDFSKFLAQIDSSDEESSISEISKASANLESMENKIKELQRKRQTSNKQPETKPWWDNDDENDSGESPWLKRQKDVKVEISPSVQNDIAPSDNQDSAIDEYHKSDVKSETNFASWLKQAADEYSADFDTTEDDKQAFFDKLDGANVEELKKYTLDEDSILEDFTVQILDQVKSELTNETFEGIADLDSLPGLIWLT